MYFKGNQYKKFTPLVYMKHLKKILVFSKLLVLLILLGSTTAMAYIGFSEENRLYENHKNIANQTEFSQKFGLAPENPKFIEYQKNKKLNQKVQTQGGHKPGFIPSPVDLSHLH